MKDQPIATHQETLDLEDIELDPEENTEEDQNEPDMVNPFDPNEIDIIPQAEVLYSIIDRLKHQEIDMNPDFQRHGNLWDNKKMSRFIESILIRFPVPAFYFDASDENKWLVVDGLQRLSSIVKFVIEKKLRLMGLEYLTDYNGCTYEYLHRIHKRRIESCPLTLFLIRPGTPDAVKYSIFRRINTGGLVLNDQEIRNAMTTPKIRECLEKLAKNASLKNAIGDQSKRMVDQEWVLRYLAFRFMDYEENKKNITNFLDEMNKMMETADDRSLELYSQSFEVAIARCWEIFGKHAFEKTKEGKHDRKRRKSSTLFETWMNALSKVSAEDMEKLQDRKESIVQKHLDLMAEDNDYFNSITFSTQKKDHYRTRKSKIETLIQGVLHD